MSSPLGGQPRPPLDLGNPAWSGWFSIAQRILQSISSSGTTAQRPTANAFIGQRWFDTSLGIPVWVQSLGPPIVWVNASGAPV